MVEIDPDWCIAIARYGWRSDFTTNFVTGRARLFVNDHGHSRTRPKVYVVPANAVSCELRSGTNGGAVNRQAYDIARECVRILDIAEPAAHVRHSVISARPCRNATLRSPAFWSGRNARRRTAHGYRMRTAPRPYVWTWAKPPNAGRDGLQCRIISSSDRVGSDRAVAWCQKGERAGQREKIRAIDTSACRLTHNAEWRGQTPWQS